MMRTFRYPLYPNNIQATTLEQWRIACQQLYNGALQERKDAWKRAKIRITYNIQTSELSILRNSDAMWNFIPSIISRSALHRINNAFNAFFRRVKAKEKPGFPRYKALSQYNTFSIGKVKVKNSHVFVPKLGPIRFNEYRPVKGTIKNIEICKEHDKWFVCIACDLGDAPTKVPIKSIIGIDLGLTTFATLNDGTSIDNPRYYRKAQANLAVKQRQLARKKRGSNNRKQAKLLVSKAHKHVKNQRLDFLRKQACLLFAQYDMIAHEKLNIKGMIQYGNLAKSIHDAAWGLFIEILTCKAESAGKWLIPVDPKGTSQRCSGCGAIVKKTLAEREHRCSSCGLVLGRDLNAAINILQLGMLKVPMANGEDMLVADEKPLYEARPTA